MHGKEGASRIRLTNDPRIFSGDEPFNSLPPTVRHYDFSPTMLRGTNAFVGLLLLFASTASAQDTTSPDTVRSWHEDAWTSIIEQEGVGISYIFYPDADNENNGVVLRLRNHTERLIRYAFTVVFRTPEAERSAVVEGRLAPGEVKTGDSAGLFWVPFRGGDHRIGEVGLRGLEITPLPGDQDRSLIRHPSSPG